MTTPFNRSSSSAGSSGSDSNTSRQVRRRPMSSVAAPEISLSYSSIDNNNDDCRRSSSWTKLGMEERSSRLEFPQRSVLRPSKGRFRRSDDKTSILLLQRHILRDGGGGRRRRVNSSTHWNLLMLLMVVLFMLATTDILPQSSTSSSRSSSLFLSVMADDQYYYNYQNNNNNNNNNDDGAAAANNANQNYQGDDQYNNDVYQYDNNNNADDDDGANNNNNNEVDGQQNNQNQNQQQQSWEDDLFDWDIPNQAGFNSVSIMPVSCINYNNGHMIKFDIFDETSSSYQCHFNQIGTFVVSISHYMRAYFNYQALVNGRDFSLPNDAGYLNCVALQVNDQGNDDAVVVDDDGIENEQQEEQENDNENGENDDDGTIQLYAKIGCMERETFTSTRLQLHLYTDAQCSEPYEDGLEGRVHSNKGYQIDGEMFSSRVSFRPPFFTCQSCAPDTISDTFNKKYGTWYDDDYISKNGEKRYSNNNNGGENDADAENDENNNNNGNDDGANNNNNNNNGNNNNYYQDDGTIDDTYMSVNDDVSRYGYGGGNQQQQKYYYSNYYQQKSQYSYVDDYNSHDDDYNGGNRRRQRDLRQSSSGGDKRKLRELVPMEGELERFENHFWRDVMMSINPRTVSQTDLDSTSSRMLYDNSYDINDWNMCQQVYKYGLYCDEDCQSLDAFRADRWSGADIILLSIMCTFMAAMMLLIAAKNLKASQRQRREFFNTNPGLEQFDTPVGINERKRQTPGLPPEAMLAIFLTVILIIVVLASLKFVNETLVFAVVTCILLFIYMLKLTLFDSRRPVLLAAPKHDEYFDDNPLDEHLFT